MKTAVIIGLGKQAFKHAEALLDFANFQILGVDPDDQASASFEENFNLKTYSSFSNIPQCFRENVSLAVICSPVSKRIETIKNLVDSGIKEFVVEKPLSVTVAECNDFLAMEDKHCCRFFVNYTYRLSTPFFQIRKMDVINKLGINYGLFHLGGRGSHQEWKHRLKSDGGVYNEMAVHMLDLSNYLFGRIYNYQICCEELVRPRRVIKGKKVDVDAPDLFVQTNEHQKATSVIVSDFLSPYFSNSVHLTSEHKQLDLKIGQETDELNEMFPALFKIDDCGNNSYRRLYSLIQSGDPENIIHRPIDTLNLIRN